MSYQKYEMKIKKFIEDGGTFLLFSNDRSFYYLLKALLKQIGLPNTNFQFITNCVDIIQKVKSLVKENQKVLILIFGERVIDGHLNVLHFKLLKELFQGNCKIIGLTAETSQENILYFHELGEIDNIIVKPISMNSLIQKIANTLEPDSELDKTIKLCKELIAARNLKEAEAKLNKVFAMKPNSSSGYLYLGDIKRIQEEYERAEMLYYKATEDSKLFLDPYKRLVSLYSEIGKIEEKLKCLQTLDELSPLNYERKIELGMTCLDLGFDDDAEKYFHESISAIKKNTTNLISNTFAEIAKKLHDTRPSLAVRYLHEAIKVKENDLTPDDIWLMNDLGILLRKQGRWEEAINAYNLALKVLPNDHVVFYNIGLAYAEGGLYKKAIEFFEKAEKISKDFLYEHEDIGLNIATAYFRIGEFTKAADYVRISLSVNADSKAAKEFEYFINSNK